MSENTRPLKVALAYPGCHRRGGVERVLVETANFLAERGHQVHVYACDWDKGVLDARVRKHHVALRTHAPLLRAALFAPHVSRLIKAGNYDACGGFGSETPDGALSWAQSVHAAWMEISGRERSGRDKLKQRLNPFHPLALAMERRIYRGRRYGHAVALSAGVADDLARFYNVPRQDITVIPNGFAPQEFNIGRRKDREARRAELGYQPDDRVVIFVANELERKGFGPLLRAVAQLNDSHVHLLAVGRLDANAYQDEIRALGLTERVRFSGPSHDVASFYAASDVFALPTQYEAWGLVIVEAMACGLPALTSRLAGAAIAIEEGITGDLLDNPREVDEIARKLRPLLEGASASPEAIARSVEQYTWPSVLQTYESLLYRLAAK